MIYKALIFSIALFSVIGCSTQATSQRSASQNEVQNNNFIYLKEGETKHLKNEQMEVTFVKIVEDSRCPKDVQCIWAGAVIVELKISNKNKQTNFLQLATINRGTQYSKIQNIEGYTFSLEKVLGEKSSNEKYQIAISIKKDK